MRNVSNGWTNRYALLALVVWAPLGLGAKGCDHAVVGDDGHCTTDCPSEGGAETGGTGGTGGGQAGKGGTAGKGGSIGTGGAAGKGGSSATGGAAGKGGSSATGGSAGTGATGGSGGGATCGGLQGLACDDGQYCQYALAAMCGAADQTGTCRPIPDACDTIFDPVCGCDGSTYSNACVAAQAGVSVAATGQCTAGQDGTCGGSSHVFCEDGLFCSYPSDADCGRADATGTCRPTPDGCTTDYNPVCGCDGMTYGNACTANMAGISVDYDGACKMSDGTTCGGITGAQCPDGQYCDFPIETQCGSGDQTGTCKITSVVCPQVIVPGIEFCGCDGKTYHDTCEAQQRGVSVASNEACPDTLDTCGGIAGAQCSDGQFCDFPPGANCGDGDQTGQCKHPYIACPDATDATPVCGCDGTTYRSACEAQQAGYAVRYSGSCLLR